MKVQIFGILLLITIVSVSLVFAHPHPGQVVINGHNHEPQHEYISLNGIIGLEKTTLFFHSGEENKLPWGFVEGKIANHADGYPVIIQFFQDGEAKHFAQTHVNDNGAYEYNSVF